MTLSSKLFEQTIEHIAFMFILVDEYRNVIDRYGKSKDVFVEKFSTATDVSTFSVLILVLIKLSTLEFKN